MLTIYGIHNCDVIQKAIKWLDKQRLPYRFHNYKEYGIDRTTLERWLRQLPIDKLINQRSTTWRELSGSDKVGISDFNKAIELMMLHHSIIKRPVWEFDDGTFFLGWDETRISEKLKTQ